MNFKNGRTLFLLCLLIIFTFLIFNHQPLSYNKGIKNTKNNNQNKYKRIVNLGLPKTGTSSLRDQAVEVLNNNQTVTHYSDCYLETSYNESTIGGNCFKKGMCGGSLMTLSKNNSTQIV